MSGEVLSPDEKSIITAGDFTKRIEDIIKAFLEGSEGGLVEAIEAVSGSLPDKPWSQVAPKLRASLEARKQFAINFVKNKQMHEALRDLLNEYAKMFGEIQLIAEPALDKILADFWLMVEKAGSESLVGGIQAGFNVAKAGFGEIPIWGGIIDLFIAGAQAFNAFAKTSAPAIVHTASMAATTKDSVGRASAIVEKYHGKIKTAQQALQAAQEATNSANPAAIKKLAITTATNHLNTVLNSQRDSKNDNLTAKAAHSVLSNISDDHKKLVKSALKMTSSGNIGKTMSENMKHMNHMNNIMANPAAALSNPMKTAKSLHSMNTLSNSLTGKGLMHHLGKQALAGGKRRKRERRKKELRANKTIKRLGRSINRFTRRNKRT